MRKSIRTAVGVAFAVFASAAAEDLPIRVATTEELAAALGRAHPGTVIELAPGEYRGGLHRAGVTGTSAAPIIVRGPAVAPGAVFTGQLQFSDPSYLVLERFTIKGSAANGLNIDDGGSFDTPAHGIVLRGLEVLDTGPRGNLDGMKLSGVDDFLIERCTIRNWGSGDGSGIDMVGCHRGLIAGCVFEDRDGGGASGVQAKGGSSDIVIRGCTFRNAGERAVNIGGSTGKDFYRPRGASYDSRGVICLGNVFIGGETPLAFVGTTESRALYNTILRPKTWALRILQERPVPEYIACGDSVVAHNLIIFEARTLRAHCNVGPNTRPETFRFEANLWYAADAPDRSRPQLPAAETGGVYGKNPGLTPGRDAPPRNTELARTHGAFADAEKKAWEEAQTRVAWAAGAATAKTIGVFVALADNKHQGIVPVPEALGNGDDPEKNLYWGTADGLKGCFDADKSWKLLETNDASGSSDILRTRAYRHAGAALQLRAFAYRGKAIKRCLEDFESAVKLGAYDLVVFIGHNGLMDFTLPDPTPPSAWTRPADSVVLCCKSEPYFKTRLGAAGGRPVLLTTQLMYPGAFLVRTVAEEWARGATPGRIRELAGAAYAANQRIAAKAGTGVFAKLEE